MQTLKLLRKPFSYNIKRALKRAKRKKTQGAEEHTRHAIIHAETVCVVYIYIYTYKHTSARERIHNKLVKQWLLPGKIG